MNHIPPTLNSGKINVCFRLGVQSTDTTETPIGL